MCRSAGAAMIETYTSGHVGDGDGAQERVGIRFAQRILDSEIEGAASWPKCFGRLTAGGVPAKLGASATGFSAIVMLWVAEDAVLPFSVASLSPAA